MYITIGKPGVVFYLNEKHFGALKILFGLGIFTFHGIYLAQLHHTIANAAVIPYYDGFINSQFAIIQGAIGVDIDKFGCKPIYSINSQGINWSVLVRERGCKLGFQD